MSNTVVEVLADSLNEIGNRLITYRIKFPRIIEAEILRHRVFSYSAASSRARNLNKHIEEVANDPFVPNSFTKDCRGMSAKEVLTSDKECRKEWFSAFNEVIKSAQNLSNLEVHKQHASRLLQPFEYQEMLMTGTEWWNFFKLRCPQYKYKGNLFFSEKDLLAHWPELEGEDIQKFNQSQAQPEIQELAELMWCAYHENSTNKVQEGDWHLPFGMIENLSLEDSIKVNVAKCARISYLTESKDYQKDIELYDKLIKMNHWSPLEHVCQCLTETEYYHIGRSVLYKGDFGFEYGWVDNIKGFKSLRRTIENE